MEKQLEQSILVNVFSRAIEFGNKWLTLSRYIFKDDDDNIFHKLEGMMFVSTIVCIELWLWADNIPTIIAFIIAILLIQRVIEFIIVYCRNFIFNRGRIFTHFHDSKKRGEWLITMFAMNITQMIFVFAYWFQLISTVYPKSFTQTMGALDSLYFSLTTFITIGGNIFPISDLAKIVTMFQGALTFFTLVIVINGLISIHFRDNK
jgi:hypothetical protein